ncbi:hypothetical protein [Phycicoccus sp. Soil748]|uniref:hypothetical protein n=1 Tax=Phycicoccus sp. Soil748 TaxID=1736397 RepID=UPI000703B536|nr:hypothetical protein [Phycicoccus sp. Soil748]KRE55070.1 hypothetical protein ASG70_06455 [Phycicoccus sp. Soil748]
MGTVLGVVAAIVLASMPETRASTPRQVMPARVISLRAGITAPSRPKTAAEVLALTVAIE